MEGKIEVQLQDYTDSEGLNDEHELAPDFHPEQNQAIADTTQAASGTKAEPSPNKLNNTPGPVF